jgi:uncharacterized protein (DUF1330 family)
LPTKQAVLAGDDDASLLERTGQRNGTVPKWRDAVEAREDLVKKLVETHGEEGVCPTAHSWREIFNLGGDGPIHIINLLKFRQYVDTPEGSISGATAYGKYSAGVGSAFARVGGQRVYFGRVGHIFGLGPVSDWDAAIVTRYRSADALARMWLSPEFIDAHKNRADGVERSQVLVFGEPRQN